jgi:hypothetical protein
MRRVILAVVVLAAASAFAVPTAGAAGGPKAAYQVGFSLNCDNKQAPFCTSVVGLGGEWGWFAFNNDGTFDATLTFCGHGSDGSGAGHVNLDGWWTTGAPTDPPIWGQSSDFYVSTDGGATWSDTDIPATAGHYQLHPAPGITAIAQVSQIP